jgi:acyl-CoA synthetase (AMP-forming)/AMP-acid ligase II
VSLPVIAVAHGFMQYLPSTISTRLPEENPMALTAADVHAKKQEITAPGAYFETQDVLLDGRSYRAYKHAPATLVDVFQSSRSHGDIEFMVYEGRRYSYTQFYAAVDALCATLQHDIGVKSGDRVAIAMRNNPDWAISYAACTLVGAVVVPINSWGKTEELVYALSDSDSRVLVCDPPRLALIEDSLEQLGLTVLLADAETDGAALPGVTRFEDAIRAGMGRAYDIAQPAPEDPCVILYTSGSTGFPKGVQHRHIALCQSLMNMFFLGYLLMELEGAREYKGGADRETPLLTVPLFHATGLLGGLLMPLQMGHKVVMMYKWDTGTALELIQAEKVTGLTSVPAVIQDLLRHPRFDEYETSSLIRIGAAGAATPAGLPELIRQKCGEPSRSAGWGMTETLAVGATMSGAVFDLNPDSAGILSPIVDMRFLDEKLQEVDAATGGEMEIYSVCCTPGYWQKPEANAETFGPDHWMKTGDIGRIDEDGFLHITGRLKEIVIRGGENIYPGEIEQAVYELPAVKENVVFGVPDQAMGEELAMVVYPGEGETLSEEDLRSFLKARLAAYKIPRHIRFWAQPLPQNASGKLHKLKVKEQFLKDF